MRRHWRRPARNRYRRRSASNVTAPATSPQNADPIPAIDSPDPGPAGFTGSLIVAEFDSLEDAQTWADADPFVAAGVYAAVIVKPFRVTLKA